MTAKLQRVLEPIRISGTRVKNRVVRSAHQTAAMGALTTEELVAYHEEPAKGGVGLTFLEIHAVHPSSGGAAKAYGSGAIEHFNRLAEMSHRYDMRMMVQLWHGGHHSLPEDDGPPWCPSDMPSVSAGAPPVAMTQGMIDDLVDAYAAAARNAEVSGLDGVELHLAHSYLPAQFLSPLTNQRTDEYGGTLENRMRFSVEVLTAIRSAVRPGFPVCVRISGNEYVEGGLGPGDAVEVIRALEERKLLDLLSLSVGNYASFHMMVAPSYAPHGYQISENAPLARGARTPTILTGRFLSLYEAEDVIARGDADLVSMVRAHIADPYLVAKTLTGVPVRPCIGCNQGCVGGTATPPRFRMTCTVNAATGRELELGSSIEAPAVESRAVVVVGGGVAGMEAARVAAERGHHVTLVEADQELGGQARLLRRVPGREEMAGIVDWLEMELHRLGVKIQTGCRATEQMPLGGVDAVVVATGSEHRAAVTQAARQQTTVPGREHLCVVTLPELVSGAPIKAGTVAVLDELSHGGGLAAIEVLMAQRKQVVVVTRWPDVGCLLEPTRVTEMARARWAGNDLTILRRAFVREAVEHGIVVGFRDGSPDVHVDTTTLVTITYRSPDHRLYSALASRVPEVRIIGDAKYGERWLEGSIKDAHNVARSL